MRSALSLLLSCVALSGCYMEHADPDDPFASAPLVECTAGLWPTYEYAPEPGQLTLNYPRQSPDYELNYYADYYLVEPSAELDLAVEEQIGLYEVEGSDPYVILGRSGPEAPWRYVAPEDAPSRCPSWAGVFP